MASPQRVSLIYKGRRVLGFACFFVCCYRYGTEEDHAASLHSDICPMRKAKAASSLQLMALPATWVEEGCSSNECAPSAVDIEFNVNDDE